MSVEQGTLTDRLRTAPVKLEEAASWFDMVDLVAEVAAALQAKGYDPSTEIQDDLRAIARDIDAVLSTIQAASDYISALESGDQLEAARLYEEMKRAVQS